MISRAGRSLITYVGHAAEDHEVFRRFMKFVSPEPMSGCWLWTGGMQTRGYGFFWSGTEDVLAHRYSWAAHFTDVSPHLQLDHRCRTRLCVNPAHLEPVTAMENSRRGESLAGQRIRARDLREAAA